MTSSMDDCMNMSMSMNITTYHDRLVRCILEGSMGMIYSMGEFP